MLFDKLIVLDNLMHKIIYISQHPALIISKKIMHRQKIHLKRWQTLDGIPARRSAETKGKLLEPLKPLFDKEQYCNMVNQAGAHILSEAGDIFQVVLSNRLFPHAYEGSMFDTFCTLRDTRYLSPYISCFYFSSDNVEMAGDISP